MRSERGNGMPHEEPTFSGQKSLGREFQDVDFLEDEEIANKVGALFNPDPKTAKHNSDELLNWIAGWQGAEVGRSQRLQDFDGAIEAAMDANGGPNWNTLTLLAETESSRPSVYAHFKILDAFEKHPDFFAPEIRAQIELLSGDPNPESQVALHKLCDFLIGMSVTSQFQQPLENEEAAARQEQLLKNIAEFARQQEQATSNYLLASHWQDVSETIAGRHSSKPDKLSGVPGASSDYIISTYNEFVLLQSYYNGILTGRRHFDPEQPLLPLAQGYFGQYKRGQLQEILPEDYSELEIAYQADKNLVRQNADEDNFIYQQLNNGPFQYPSFTLSNFLRRIEKQGRQFYFNVINDDLDDPRHPNTKRLNPQTLHPETLAKILGHNYKLLHQHVKPSQPLETISAHEYLKKLFPAGKHTTAETYLYQDMVSLQRRKRIEQDLGENLANIPPYGQVQLLKFLATKSKAEFVRVIGVTDRWGTRDQNPARQDFLLSFLACGENQANGEVILKLAEKLPPELSAKVFAKYAEIAKSSEGIKSFLAKHWSKNSQYSEEGMQKIVQHLFSKSNQLLKDLAGKIDNAENVDEGEILNYLDNFNTEILLFAASCKGAAKERTLDFEQIKGAEIEAKDSGDLKPEERAQLHQIFIANRQGRYPQKLLDYTAADFEKTLNEPGHTFRILKFNGKPVVFFHYDQIDEDTLYVGSLNLDPSAQDSPLAVAMLRTAMQEQGEGMNLRAVVWDGNPLLKVFYKRVLGFKEESDPNKRKIPDYGNTGESYTRLIKLAKPEALEKAA